MTQMSAGRRQRRRLSQLFTEAFAPLIAPERQGDALKALLVQFDGEPIASITRSEFVIRCKHAMKPFLEGGGDGEPRANGLRDVSAGTGAAADDTGLVRGRAGDLVDVCTLSDEEEADAIRLALFRLDDAATHLRIATEAQKEPKDPFFAEALDMLNCARYDLARLTGIAVERTSAPTKEDA